MVKDTLVKTLQEELKISHERITAISADIDSMRKDCESKVSSLVQELKSVKLESQSRIKELEVRLHSVECELLTLRETSVQKDSLIA